MIGTAIGTGAAVRPFYNRAGVGAVPLARTALGTTRGNSPGGDVFIFGVTAPANMLVTVGVVYTDFASIGVVPVYWNSDGAFFTNDTFLVAGIGGFVVAIYSYNTGVTARVADAIGVQFSAGFGGDPAAYAVVAARCAGIIEVAPQDRVQGATGSSSDQDSGLTVLATTQPKEFVWGIIGTSGSQADTVGTWQAGLSAGQNRGTVGAGCQIKEGFLLAAATAQQRSRVTGATVREFVSLVQTYKGT